RRAKRPGSPEPPPPSRETLDRIPVRPRVVRPLGQVDRAAFYRPALDPRKDVEEELGCDVLRASEEAVERLVRCDLEEGLPTHFTRVYALIDEVNRDPCSGLAVCQHPEARHDASIVRQDCPVD